MGEARVLTDRAVRAGRRITGTPEWPLVAGALLGLVATIEVVLGLDESGAGLSAALLLVLCATVPLAFAPAHVGPAATAITAATVLTFALGGRLTGAALVAQLAVGYLLGRRCSGRSAALILVPLLLALVAYAVVAPLGGSGPARVAQDGVGLGGVGGLSRELLAAVLASLTAAAAGLGSILRIRRAAADRDASARAVANTLLEHAARGERARIARELHDVVAHHISMIAVQAETARLATPGMPTDGAKRLLAIGDTARTALTEMRRLLGVLREDAGTEPTRRPQPGLHQLNELIDEARGSTGASTRLIVYGRVIPLDPGIEITAYRIVQEALTNVRRHAPGAAVDVELQYTDDALVLRVRDNGPGPAMAGAGRVASGHGLLGMRERTAALGGTLRTGPAPVNGFLVEATLPKAAAG